MDDGSASLFCFTPLRVTVSEWDRLRAAPSAPESSLGPGHFAPASPQGPCPVGPSDSSTELMALVEDLRRQVSALHAQVERLERESLELRQQAGYWKSRHRDALDRVAALEQKVEHLESDKRQLQADLFGRRSEAQPGNDRSNGLDDPRTTPQNPSGTGASNRATRVPSDGITPICPSVRSSSDCLPSDRSALAVASPCCHSATRKTRSKSRSRCLPIAG